MGTTITRKKPRTIDKLSPGEKYEALTMYKEAVPTQEIADKYQVTKSTMDKFFHKEVNGLVNIREVNVLTSQSKHNFKVTHVPKFARDLNASFLAKIKDDNADMAYAYYYAMTGDNRLSLSSSGLDVDIIKPDGKNDSTVLSTIRLRGIYLRTMPHVSKEIDKIREERLKSNPVTKKYIQSNLIEQIEQIQESLELDNTSKNRGYLLKSIELLGKTVSAFSERIEVSQVDPSSALDQLIQMSKSDVNSTYTIE